MDSRLLILAIPSAIILAALLWHSFQALPRRRATAFWLSVIAYGFLRGIGVHRVTAAIGASFPYEIHNPTLSIAGVSAQEVAGWAVVSYLAWWIGYRFSLSAAQLWTAQARLRFRKRRQAAAVQSVPRPFLFLQMAWAALFLGAISWVVEAAAIAARWWHWTVPTASRVFLNVPAIGIVDWFFVAIDFLLPFAAITAPALAARRSRYLTLLLFPAHFGAHLLPGLWLHAVHWTLVLIVLWLAIRSDAEDVPFADERSWIPSAGFALIVLDVVVVEVLVVKRPELLQSIAPALVIWLAALRPAVATTVAAASLVMALKLPSMLVATAVGTGAVALLWLRRRGMAIVTLVLIAAFAFGFHRHTAADRADMTRRLDRAIAERNRGSLRNAIAELEATARDHPNSHVALALAGEIYYRTNQLDLARAKFARAVDIKQDFVRGYRLLAAIDLRRGRQAEASNWASQGLEVAPDDLQLRYLAARAAGRSLADVLTEIKTPEVAAGMAALAFEVGDIATAQRITEEGVARWPSDPRLTALQTRLASL